MLKRIVVSLVVVALGNIPLNTHTIHIKQISQVDKQNPGNTAQPHIPPQYASIATIPEITLTPLPEAQPIAVVETLPTPTPAPATTYSYAAVGTYGNSYDYGQCTWGVASMKQNIPNNWGNANEWVAGAKLAGITVSNVPVVGAVGVSFGGLYGHVVVVTALNSDGTIEITETNYNGNGDGLHRSRPAAVSEFEYIYL